MELKVTKVIEVTMLTYGGKNIFSLPVGERFQFGAVLTTNPSYTVIQNGLNYYVFPTDGIELPEGYPIVPMTKPK